LQRFVVSSISTRSKQFEYYRKCWDLIRVSLDLKIRPLTKYHSFGRALTFVSGEEEVELD
ncbi:MAG: hypothetical protein ABW087_12520, partial [Candidatus Thiodiazotropha sp.]